MKPKTFSPIILHKNPVEIPKVIGREYSLDAYTDMNPSEENSSDVEDDDDSEEDDDDSEEDDEEMMCNEPLKNHLLSNNTPPSSAMNATEYMNKMTLDLMMNPHYLSKANPEAFQRKKEQAQRILKHQREIYKTMDVCFDALARMVSGNGQDDIDLDVQTGFLHFAKTVLLNIQQQNAGKSGNEPIFSVCNDIHSSFYPDEER